MQVDGQDRIIFVKLRFRVYAFDIVIVYKVDVVQILYVLANVVCVCPLNGRLDTCQTKVRDLQSVIAEERILKGSALARCVIFKLVFYLLFSNHFSRL